MSALSLVGPRKVRVSSAGVASFNRAWPCSRLDSNRAYWFEFDSDGNLIDDDIPCGEDGPESVAMAEDCQRWLDESELPEWAPD